MWSRLLAMTCGACVLAGSGVATADPPPAPLPGEVHTAVAAAAKTEALLAALVLPAGTTVEEPSTAPLLQVSSGFPPADPSFVVDQMQWWSVPGTDAAFSAYLATLAPPGLTGYSSPGSDRQPATTSFGQTGLSHSQDVSLTIEHVPDGDHVDVRIDSYVVWLQRRTAAETIPATVTSAVLDYVSGPDPFAPYGGEDTTPKPRHAHVTVTGPELRRIIRDLNAMPPDGPWERSCAPGPNEGVTLVFTIAGHRKVFKSPAESCGDIEVEAYARDQPYLVGSYVLLADVHAVLGIRSTPIPRVPPQGPPVTTPAPVLTVLEHNKVQAERVGDQAFSTVGLHLPGDTGGPIGGGPPLPAYSGPGHFVDRAMLYRIDGTRKDLVAWFRRYAPRGYVAAEPVKGPKGVRLLVLEPRDHSKPVSAIVWISMEQRGGHVDFRIDAQTAWLPKPT